MKYPKGEPCGQQHDDAACHADTVFTALSFAHVAWREQFLK
jgi:hypothetical protein